jgi:hypothetical protein
MVIDELLLVNEMPRTSSGKVDRGALMRNYIELHPASEIAAPSAAHGVTQESRQQEEAHSPV